AAGVVAQGRRHGNAAEVLGVSLGDGLGAAARGAEKQLVGGADGDLDAAEVGGRAAAAPDVVRLDVGQDLEAPAGLLSGADGGGGGTAGRLEGFMCRLLNGWGPRSVPDAAGGSRNETWDWEHL